MTEWREIATAPKDRDVLLFDRYDRVGHEGRWLEPTSAAVRQPGWYWAGYNDHPVAIQPSHWAPLPPPPVTAAGERDA